MRKGKTPDDLMMEYYLTIKDQYPHLTQQQIFDICRTPFKLIVKEMKSNTLRDIRIRYLGTFTVYQGRVRGILNKVKEQYEKGRVPAKTVDFYQTMLDNYITNNATKHGKDSLD